MALISNDAVVVSEAPSREKEVKKQFDYLVSKIAVVQDSLNELDKRLTPVMRNAEMEVATGDSKPLHVLAPLADDIRDQMCRIENIADRIRQIIERLEI